MKLNLGCGKTYKKGYINIDAYDTTVADKKISVENLPYPSESIEEIHATHLIEHLGYQTTRYALAEWFRVLKPNGTLYLETPDIETAFKSFQNATLNAKKEILTWIYGIEQPGMEHRLCYPQQLIQTLLEKTGFTSIKITSETQQQNHPTLKIHCKKQTNNIPHQLIAHYRKKLQSKKLNKTTNNYIDEAQEHLIDFFQTKIQQYLNNKTKRTLDELTTEGCITSPTMTHLFLEQCIKQNIIPKTTINTHLTLARFLKNIHYIDLIIHLIKQTPTTPGTQQKTNQLITTLARQSITKMLSDKNQQELIQKQLQTQSNKIRQKNTIIFSEKILEYQAAQCSYQAVKAFHLHDYPEAIKKMKQAIQLDRNHILYYWNLGRLLMLTNKTAQATQHYHHALTLIKKSNHPNRKVINQQLKQEQTEFSEKQFNTPLVELRT